MLESHKRTQDRQLNQENSIWTKWEIQRDKNHKKEPRRILELINMMNEMKNSVEKINSRLEQVEEKIWEWEGRSFEIIKAGRKKK